MPLSLLDDAAVRAALALGDLTDPADGPHAMQLIIDEMVAAVGRDGAPVIDVQRGSRVVPTADNYDNLGYSADAITRDARYTRYVDDHRVLRGHTSALIPPALRRLASTEHDDVLIVAPGVCHRRDSIDWQHTGNPHQLDLWRIRRGTRDLTDVDLMAMIATVVAASLPGAEWRTVASTHPYTEHGRQIDVRWTQRWIEIGECGLAAGHVLRRAKLGDEWSGLAMGVGLDRLVMLRKGIPDIRLLRSTEPRIASQMLDLAPYRPVSLMPSIRRDLSLAVGPDVAADNEAIGDRVRDALGPDADIVEAIEVLGETAPGALPPAARQRLGIQPGQRNLLIRLVLRALDRTLTDQEANVTRERVYAALHEGTTL